MNLLITQEEGIQEFHSVIYIHRITTTLLFPRYDGMPHEIVILHVADHYDIVYLCSTNHTKIMINAVNNGAFEE